MSSKEVERQLISERLVREKQADLRQRLFWSGLLPELKPDTEFIGLMLLKEHEKKPAQCWTYGIHFSIEDNHNMTLSLIAERLEDSKHGRIQVVFADNGWLQIRGAQDELKTDTNTNYGIIEGAHLYVDGKLNPPAVEALQRAVQHPQVI